MWAILLLLSRINALQIIWKGQDYSITHKGETFAEGAPTAFYMNGKWSAKGFEKVANIEESDKYGSYQGQSQSYGIYETETRNYDGFVMFTYTISLDVSTTGLDRDEILGNFPVFQNVSFKNIISWSGSFVQGKRSATYGTTGGPYLFYNDAVSGPCFLASAVDNFLVTSRVDHIYTGAKVDWAPGVAATVKKLEAGFSHSFILVVGNGITDTLYKWGQILQKAYNSYKLSDLTLTHIGYQTDNGAQYCFCRSDCNNVLLNVTSTLAKQGIELGYLSFQGAGASSSNGKAPWCVTEWGVDGGLGRNYPMDLETFHEQIKLPLQLYAPYFCNDTKYNETYPMVESDPSLQGCGDFDFKDPAPEVSRKFYDWFFAKGESVGMFSYEPDFMNQNYNCMPAFQGDVDSGALWTDGMANAALAKNITVQWCYATPAFVLQALNYPAVTNFRGSLDFYYGHSYEIGFSSLLIWALGSFPSKDTFWTSDNGKYATTLGGCDKKGCPDDHNDSGAELHTLLALMTTGPVGFSDALGQTNTKRLRRTCRSDGALLKPDKAATSIDATFSKTRAPDGGVYMTFSGTVDQPRAYYIIAFNMKSAWTMSTSDFWPPLQTNQSYVVRQFYDRDSPESIQRLDVEDFREIQIEPNDPKEPLFPTFLIISPICENGWALLGDLDAYAAFATLRIVGISCSGDDLNATVRGVKGEHVNIGAYSPDNEIKTKILNFENDGILSISFS